MRDKKFERNVFCHFSHFTDVLRFNVKRGISLASELVFVYRGFVRDYRLSGDTYKS
jgi:hypothetical protein